MLCLVCSLLLITGVEIVAIPNGPSLGDFINAFHMTGQPGHGQVPVLGEIIGHLYHNDVQDGILGILILGWLSIPVGVSICVRLERWLGPLGLDSGPRRLLFGFALLHLCYIVSFPVFARIPRSGFGYGANLPDGWALAMGMEFFFFGPCQLAGLVLAIAGLRSWFQLCSRATWLSGAILGISLPHFALLLFV